jgi:hypothetical protein
MIIGGVEFNVGSTIRFRTRNAYDTNIYKGVVTGIVRRDIATLFNRDIDVYQSNVAKTYSAVEDLNNVDFFVLKTEIEDRVPFSEDWVDPASIALVSQTDSVVLKIFDIVETDIPIIRSILTSNNYRNEIVS